MKFKLPNLSKRKRNKEPKPKLVNSLWSIMKSTLADFRAQWKLFVLLAAVVEVPSAFIRQFSSSDSSSIDFSIVLFIASMFALVALFWLVQGRSKSKKITQLYTESSKRFLPLFFLSVLLTLIFLPLFGGLFLVFLTVFVGFGMIYNLIGIGLTIASLVVLVRLLLSVAYVIDPKVKFKDSLILSWQLTKRRFWYVLWSAFAFIVPLSFVVGILTYLITKIPVVGPNVVTHSILNGVLASIALPLLVLYWNKIAENISRANGKK